LKPGITQKRVAAELSRNNFKSVTVFVVAGRFRVLQHVEHGNPNSARREPTSDLMKRLREQRVCLLSLERIKHSH